MGPACRPRQRRRVLRFARRALAAVRVVPGAGERAPDEGRGGPLRRCGLGPHDGVRVRGAAAELRPRGGGPADARRPRARARRGCAQGGARWPDRRTAQRVTREAQIDDELGLGFDEWDLRYYTDLFRDVVKRDPTDVECFDMAQSNSEHSRHWFFGGRLVVDGVELEQTLFAMVKSTLTDERRRNRCAGVRSGGPGLGTGPPSLRRLAASLRFTTTLARSRALSRLLSGRPSPASRRRSPRPCPSCTRASPPRPTTSPAASRRLLEQSARQCNAAAPPPAPFRCPCAAEHSRCTHDAAHRIPRGTAALQDWHWRAHPGQPSDWKGGPRCGRDRWVQRGQPARARLPAAVGERLLCVRGKPRCAAGHRDRGQQRGQRLRQQVWRARRRRLYAIVRHAGPGRGAEGMDQGAAAALQPSASSSPTLPRCVPPLPQPIMFSAGLGYLDDRHRAKSDPSRGMLVIKLGGPAYRIGMGGGAASSRVQVCRPRAFPPRLPPRFPIVGQGH